jgi:hypothetical protein
MESESDDYADGWDSDESEAFYSNEAFKSLSNIVDVQGAKLLDFGLSEEDVISAYEKSGLSLVAMTQAFSLSGRNVSILVFMRVARNT